MDANGWLIVSIAGYSLAGILLVAATIMFIKMNVLAIIGDLTGRTAARQIQEIREQNSKTGDKRFRPSAFNAERGFLTEPMSSRLGRSGKIGKTGQGLTHKSKRLSPSGQMQETGSKRLVLPLADNNDLSLNAATVISGEAVLRKAAAEVGVTLLPEATTVLSEERGVSAATTVLSEEQDVSMATTVLKEKQDMPAATMVLKEEQDMPAATTVLKEEQDVSMATMVLKEEQDVPTATTLSMREPDFSASTEVLLEGADISPPTEVLTQGDETTVLYPTTELINEETESETADFKIVKDIKVIHTAEVI